MEWWQVILGAFLVLLPVVLMLDFWGDERLDSRGKPIPREWFRQIDHERLDAAATFDTTVGVTGHDHAGEASHEPDSAPVDETGMGLRTEEH